MGRAATCMPSCSSPPCARRATDATQPTEAPERIVDQLRVRGLPELEGA